MKYDHQRCFTLPGPSPTPPLASLLLPGRKRWRRRKAAGETPPSPSQQQGQSRAKTARKPKRPQTATSNKQHPKASSVFDNGPNNTGADAVEPDSPERRQLRESASSQAGIPSAAGATPAATTAHQQGPVAAAGRDREKLESPARARQRLEQAKELDQEVAASQGGGGG